MGGDWSGGSKCGSILSIVNSSPNLASDAGSMKAGISRGRSIDVGWDSLPQRNGYLGYSSTNEDMAQQIVWKQVACKASTRS